MAYDRDQFAPSPVTLGTKGATIDYSSGDVVLGASVKAVQVVAAGNVVYRPAGETSGSITVTEAPVGMVLLHVPGVIFQSGTTATLVSVED